MGLMKYSGTQSVPTCGNHLSCAYNVCTHMGQMTHAGTQHGFTWDSYITQVNMHHHDNREILQMDFLVNFL